MNSIGSSRLLEAPGVREVHEKMKEVIIQRVREFQQKNPLISFAVFGSSNLVLQNALVVPAVPDVDLYCIGANKNEIVPVEGVDILTTPFIHPDALQQVIFIEGFSCLSIVDTMVASVSGLRKGKTRNLQYLYILLAYDEERKKAFTQRLEEAMQHYPADSVYHRAAETFKALYYEKSKDEIRAHEDCIVKREVKVYARNSR